MKKFSLNTASAVDFKFMRLRLSTVNRQQTTDLDIRKFKTLNFKPETNCSLLEAQSSRLINTASAVDFKFSFPKKLYKRTISSLNTASAVDFKFNGTGEAVQVNLSSQYRFRSRL